MKTVHIHLVARARNFVCATLMELVITLAAVETLEEQPPTAFAERQSKKGLPHELMRYVRHYR